MNIYQRTFIATIILFVFNPTVTFAQSPPVRLIQLSDKMPKAVEQAKSLLSSECQRPLSLIKIANTGACIADNFASPLDPLPMMSPSLTTFSAGQLRLQCDSHGGIDRWFFASMRIPFSKTCGAVLVVRVKRQHLTEASNDSFGLGDAKGDFSDINLHMTSQVWGESPSLNSMTFAVAIPASLINTIINNNNPAFLDFYMQDDTNVDHVSLLLGQ